MAEEYENGVYTPKIHQMSSATITGRFEFVLRKSRSEKSRNRDAIVTPFLKCLTFTRKRKADGLKSISEKLRCRDGFVWTAFSYSPGVWTLPQASFALTETFVEYILLDHTYQEYMTPFWAIFKFVNTLKVPEVRLRNFKHRHRKKEQETPRNVLNTSFLVAFEISHAVSKQFIFCRVQKFFISFQ